MPAAYPPFGWCTVQCGHSTRLRHRRRILKPTQTAAAAALAGQVTVVAMNTIPMLVGWAGEWAKEGLWGGDIKGLSCKRRLSRTTYLCLQRCGQYVPCPAVRLICIFCACLVPCELVSHTHTIYIHTHWRTHMLQLLHLWNSAVSLSHCFLQTFLAILAGLRPATHSHTQAIIVEWTHSPVPTSPFPPMPRLLANIPCRRRRLRRRRWARCFGAGHNSWNVLTCTRLYADLLPVAVLWQICFAHLMWFRPFPHFTSLHSCAYLPSPLRPLRPTQSFVRVVAALSWSKVLFRAI